MVVVRGSSTRGLLGIQVTSGNRTRFLEVIDLKKTEPTLFFGKKISFSFKLAVFNY